MLKFHNKKIYIMKPLHIVIIIYLSIFTTFTSCKGQEKENINTITNNQTTITKSGVYYYKPNLNKIDSLKKTLGEDNFYIIADDNNAYFSEIVQKLDNNIIKLETRSINFKDENITINLDSLNNNWGIIEYSKGNKPKIFSFVDYNLYLINNITNENSGKNENSIRINETSLFAYQKEYKDIIINEMSLTTSLEIVDEKRFNLTYEYNGSSIKQKQVYNFIYNENAIHLISKEILKYGQKGSLSNKIYLKNYILTNQFYSELEEIGSSLNDSYSENNSLAFTYLYDNLYNKVGIINYTITNDNKFIQAPLEKEEYVKDIMVINLNKLNDVAYYLEQCGAYKESISLLDEILKNEPQRLVAWLNLADAQWGNEDKLNAKIAYKKYISQMKSQHKDVKKIPQRVYDRIK